jgi:hypothetical protein
MYNLTNEQMAIIQTHPVVSYFGMNAVAATLGYQVMKRAPTEETAEAVEKELLNTILNDHDTFFQWVSDFMEGNF